MKKLNNAAIVFLGFAIVLSSFVNLLLKPDVVQAQSNGSVILITVGAPSNCAWPVGVTVTNGMILCATNSTISPLYYAVNGGAFAPLITAGGGTTYTGTLPIVVTGTVINCPTCVSTANFKATFDSAAITATTTVQ
jgi:hypothetical protein